MRKLFVLGLILSVFATCAHAGIKKNVAMMERCKSITPVDGRTLEMKMLLKKADKFHLRFGWGKKDHFAAVRHVKPGKTSLYGGVMGYVDDGGAQVAEDPSRPNTLTAIFTSSEGKRYQVVFACDYSPFSPS